MTMLCDNYEANGTIARYVAREMGEDEAAAFENHFLTCERCQRSIEVGWSVRAQPAAIRPRYVRTKAILLTAAAASAIFLGVRGFRNANVKALGVVDTAPIYLGAEMRASGDANARFNAAMNAYTAGHYSAAAQQLAVVEEASTDPVAPFFRGASMLMERRARDAAAEFTKVINAGESLYLAEAYYYRAKAHLQRGERDDAVEDLKAATAHAGPMHDNAARLLQQLSD